MKTDNINFRILFCLISLNWVEILAGSRRDNGQKFGRRYGQFCSTTIPCPDNQCCRDDGGNLVGASEGPFLEPIEANGTCTRTKSRPGEVCVSSCGCVKGYTCYRTVTGFCCPPYTCWESEAAERDRKYWENCRPPTCFFPPVANPGGSP